MELPREASLDIGKVRTDEAIALLGTSLTAGLGGAEAEKRLKEHGRNEVPEKRTNPLVTFARKFWGLTAWMLEAIVVLSWYLHRYSDFYIVTGLLVVNAIIGFAQEHRASRAVEALKKRLQVTARVLRDGTWKMVPARELVPGDVIRVRPGDFVPADTKIAVGELEVDQSALTGESLVAVRRPDDVLYSGSIVRRGEANAVVILTGPRTYFGRTVQLVQIARPKLHMEDIVSQVVRWLLAIVGGLLAVVLVVSLVRGVELLEILPLMLVLLLSAIPVALPVMFTVSMAVGAMELARKNVLVTRLSAAEDAANMDVLCVDKTGTITMNRLALANVIPLGGATEEDVILYGALASEEANHDAIDLAFLTAAKKRGWMKSSFAIQRFAPFDSETRRTEALVTKDGQEFRVMKGAVRGLAQACGLDQAAIEDLEARVHDYVQRGHRILAVAKADGREEPRLVGLVTLYDAVREDALPFIEELRHLGVSVKMLTGDALPIAQEVAHEVGLDGEIQRMSDLADLAAHEPVRAAELAERSSGFAEIYPEGKYNVVKSFQTKGHVVGMTGDGVNDAPALRQAEVGIAVSNAVDVAKGAASVVLTAESLPGIVNLVKNGRKVYQRIATWIVNKISRTILKAGFVVLAFLLTGKYVVSAFGMILVVFMTDFAKIALSTDNVRGSKEPDTWNVRHLATVGVILGLLMVLEALGLLYIGLRAFHLEANEPALQTFTFELLLYFAIFSLFAVRERGHFWHSVPSTMLLAVLLIDAVIGGIIATVGIPGLPAIPVSQTVCVAGYSFVFALVINDWVKVGVLKRTRLGW